MAIYVQLNRQWFNILRSSACLFSSKQILQRASTKSVDLIESQILDHFTDRLIQRKLEKWHSQKLKLKALKITSEPTMPLQVTENCIDRLSTEEVNALFDTVLEKNCADTVISLVQECVEHRKCPKLAILHQILSILSQRGEKDLIINIIDLCSESDPSILQANASFKPYLAEAIWIRGNIMKSLEMFEEIYRSESYIRRKVRLMLNNLIAEMIPKSSEAVLKKVLEMSERLLKEYNDYYLLCSCWQACILSEWFADQNTAIEMIENNKDLCEAVSNKLPFVILISLRNHRTDVVYRLLEVFLKHEMTSQCAALLVTLFDYYLKQRNIHTCNEILQWCAQNGIELPNAHNDKLIKLLVKDHMGLTEPIKRTSEEKYDYKF